MLLNILEMLEKKSSSKGKGSNAQNKQKLVIVDAPEPSAKSGGGCC